MNITPSFWVMPMVPRNPVAAGAQIDGRRRRPPSIDRRADPAERDRVPECEPAVDHVAQVPLAGLDGIVVRALQDVEGGLADLGVAGLPRSVDSSASS